MTPLRQQYLRIKKQFPDTIVLFRLGEIVETFSCNSAIAWASAIAGLWYTYG